MNHRLRYNTWTRDYGLDIKHGFGYEVQIKHYIIGLGIKTWTRVYDHELSKKRIRYIYMYWITGTQTPAGR